LIVGLTKILVPAFGNCKYTYIFASMKTMTGIKQWWWCV